MFILVNNFAFNCVVYPANYRHVSNLVSRNKLALGIINEGLHRIKGRLAPNVALIAISIGIFGENSGFPHHVSFSPEMHQTVENSISR